MALIRMPRSCSETMVGNNGCYNCGTNLKISLKILRGNELCTKINTTVIAVNYVLLFQRVE